MVLDTNILLTYQHFLQALIAFLRSSCWLLIPVAVIRELDVQKNCPYLIDVFEAGRFVSQQPMSQLARQAYKWLLALVISHPSSVALQKLTEELEQLQKHKDGDTRILTYTYNIYHQAKSREVNTITALLSNDTLLRLRAQSAGICSLAMADFHHSPRQIKSHICDTVSILSNQAVSGPSNPSMAPRLLPWPAPPSQPPFIGTNNHVSSTSFVPFSQDGQFTFTLLLLNISQPSDLSSSMGPDQKLI
ncbi:hypothetical protein PSTG_11419 [Puccinia striiformis f. sp. tritici PST-78]|uniref:PIN domain-containing protein n=1 Tax=Puccinia striiformis f. sp. tritici PST-78 TaxID=1165861 RepID=A0A0L0V7J5_9BASI|nr:hypothetical protein PSTG_11419 [Puccinia striiformis f. sp. tritici PST-78]